MWVIGGTIYALATHDIAPDIVNIDDNTVEVKLLYNSLLILFSSSRILLKLGVS